MITTISKFDHLTAAGLLARAALSVMDKDNPAGAYKIENEQLIRNHLLVEIRTKLGIKADDQTPVSLEKITQRLDDESDCLIGAIDEHAALETVSNQGFLPSDLFSVVVHVNLEKNLGKRFAHESKLISDTVKSPDQEQHYGEPIGPDEPFLISLFAKTFTNKFPLRSFTLLVAGQRQGLQLVVHQAWRIYADQVDLRGASDLVTMLERFTDKFGAEIEINGQKGHFFKVLNLPDGVQTLPEVKITLNKINQGKIVAEPAKHITWTYFFQRNPKNGNLVASLGLAIDVKRYEKFIQERGE